MKIAAEKEKEYEETKAVTPYGIAIYSVAENWADLMESLLEPKNLERDMAAVARLTYRDADTEGLTGLTYNFAVEILSRYWIHGKSLNQALARVATNKVEEADYKARLQRLERRVLNLSQEKIVELPA